MRQEYGEMLIGMFVYLGLAAIIFLVLDLFKDGIFYLGMGVYSIVVFIVFGISFLIQTFTLNYKIEKRD